MIGGRGRRLVIAVIAMASGVALGASLAPTMAAWVDRGGSSMTITAIQEPPPEVTGPVQPGTGTTFQPSTPAWSGLNNAPNPTATSACYTVTVFTTSIEPTRTPWTIVMHTGQPPFNNVPPFSGFQGGIFGENASYTITSAADYATSGIMLVTPAQPFQYASATVGYTVKLCVVNTPEPAWQPAGDDTYQQVVPLQLVRNGSQPCVAGTVVGEQPYFVGFTILFNWKDFLDERLAAAAITQGEYNQWVNYKHWAGGPPGYLPSQGATGTDFQVSLQGYASESRNVSNIAPVTIASCSY